MKISKEIWIDEKVKWNALRKRTLNKKNFYKGQAYMVCTSPNPQLLFEIVEAKYIGSRYNGCVLLAVCKHKQQAIERVMILVDQLYNQKCKTYEALLE